MRKLCEFLCYSNPAISNVPYFQDLVKIFPLKTCENEINWIAASDTFPRFTQLLAFHPYTYNVFLGLVVSVGGITESLVSFPLYFLKAGNKNVKEFNIKNQ